MRRLLPLLLLPLVASAADPLPEGAEMRLGIASGICVDSRSAFSPDGKRLATIPKDGTVSVWDVATGKLLYTHPKPPNRVEELVWTPDGKLFGTAVFRTNGLLLTGWADEKDEGLTEKAWDELHEAAKLADPDAPRVHHSARTRDGRRVAMLSNGQSGRVAVYRVALNTSTHLLDSEVDIPLPGGEFVGFSDDGNTLFTVQPNAKDGDRVAAYDLTSKTPDKPAWVLEVPREADREEERDGKKVKEKGKGYPQRVRSKDGKRVVLEYPDPQGILEVWDGPKGKKLYSWAFPPSHYQFEKACLDFSPDGKRLAVSAREKGGLVGEVVYDLDGGKEVAKLTPGPSDWVLDGALRYTPDGKRLLRGRLVWDAATGKDLTPAGLGHHGRVVAVLVSGDGKTIVTTGSDFTARGWDAKTGEEKWRAVFPYVAWELTRLDGDTAVATSSRYDTQRRHTLLDLNSGKLSSPPGGMAKERTVKVAGANRTVQSSPLAVSADGTTAVSVDWQKPALEVWDWPSGKRREVLKFDLPAKTRLAEIHGVSFTADGNELIGVFSYWDIKPDHPPGVDGFIHAEQNCLERWDIARGVRVERVTYEKNTPAAVATNGKRRLLLRPGKVTDLDTKQTLLTITNEEKEPVNLHAASLSADGKTLAAGLFWAGRVELHWYDLTTGKQLAARSGDWEGFMEGQLAFLPDGRLVSVRDEVLVWKAVK